MISQRNSTATGLLISYLDSQGFKFTTLKDITRVFNMFYNFVSFSKELLVEDAAQDKRDFYLGPCLSGHHSSGQLPQELLNDIHRKGPERKSIIYCSMGSWADEINTSKAQQVFNMIIESMQSETLRGYQLVVVAGKLAGQLENFESANVRIYEWLPQMEILKYTALAVIHGGIGSIKECIIRNVPMMITPLGIDQYENAKRITHHELGQELDLPGDGINELLNKAEVLLNDAGIIKRLEQMNSYFKRDAESAEWLEIIDGIIKC